MRYQKVNNILFIVDYKEDIQIKNDIHIQQQSDN